MKTAPIKLTQGKLIQKKEDEIFLYDSPNDFQRRDGRVFKVHHIKEFFEIKKHKPLKHPVYRYQQSCGKGTSFKVKWFKGYMEVGCITFTNNDLAKIKKLISD